MTDATDDVPSGSLGDAVAASERAQRGSGIEIRMLEALPELEAVYALFDRIWQPAKTNVPVTVEQLRAMTHAGNYLAGAYDDRRLVGACLGFFAAPPGSVLHSHVAGVDPAVQSRGVGFALKVHQRAWALDHGLSTVTWTFDPLVRRNAYFNLAKLGAMARTYLVDFYGDMADAINAGQGSDRLLIEWDLASPAVARACRGEAIGPDPHRIEKARLVVAESEAGEPILEEPILEEPILDEPSVERSGADRVVLIQAPSDIEALRQRDPEAGRRWRGAVRDALGGRLDAGGIATGLTTSGAYVVELMDS